MRVLVLFALVVVSGCVSPIESATAVDGADGSPFVEPPLDGAEVGDMAHAPTHDSGQPRPDLAPTPPDLLAPTCGALAGQPCCTGPGFAVCNLGPNVVCNSVTLHCEGCGGAGQRCCQDGANAECISPDQMCARPVTAISACVRCGVANGDPCCAGNVCKTSGMTCDPGVKKCY